MFCVSSGNIYLSLSISLSCSSITVSELFCCEVFEIYVILSAILLPVQSPVAFALFLIAPFEAVSSTSVAHCLA